MSGSQQQVMPWMLPQPGEDSYSAYGATGIGSSMREVSVARRSIGSPGHMPYVASVAFSETGKLMPLR